MLDDTQKVNLRKQLAALRNDYVFSGGSGKYKTETVFEGAEWKDDSFLSSNEKPDSIVGGAGNFLSSLGFFLEAYDLLPITENSVTVVGRDKKEGGIKAWAESLASDPMPPVKPAREWPISRKFLREASKSLNNVAFGGNEYPDGKGGTWVMPQPEKADWERVETLPLILGEVTALIRERQKNLDAARVEELNKLLDQIGILESDVLQAFMAAGIGKGGARGMKA